MKRVKSWLNTIHGRMFMVSASVIMMVIACMVLVFHRNVQRDMDTQVRLAQQKATETSGISSIRSLSPSRVQSWVRRIRSSSQALRPMPFPSAACRAAGGCPSSC